MTIERLLPGSALQAYPPADRWDLPKALQELEKGKKG